jgi:NDP-sugar pyrophosphorylase family protein
MENSLNKAMILAAGEGTRLRPLTLETPRVLVPVAGVPQIYYTFSWLKRYGIQEVYINLFYLGDKLRQSLGDGSKFGLNIHYSSEQTLLGTAGGVKKLDEFFDGPFVVIYGDVLTDFDLAAMLEYHLLNKSTATIALTRVPNPWEKGIVQLDDKGKVLSFVEKPPEGTEPGNLANGGIYILEKRVLDFIPEKGYCDFAFNVFPELLSAKLPIYGYVLSARDYLIDIGSIASLRQASDDVKSGKLRIANNYPNCSGG